MSAFTPFAFQEADLATLAEHDYRGFVVAETGAGKSLIGTEAGLRSPAQRILVIGVKSTIQDVWVQGILRQDPTQNVKVIDGSPKGKQALEEFEWGYPGWYICTHAQFTRSDFSLCEPHLTIVDEAHLLANVESKGNQKLKKLKSKRFIMMSGTMVRNKFENFYGLLRVTYPERNGEGDIADISRNRWIRTWCEWEEDHFAPNGMKVIGEKNPGALAAAIPCYIQHFKRERCCEFHPNGFLEGLDAPRTETVRVDLTLEQKRLIRQMEEDYVAWLEDQSKNKQIHIAKLPMVARTRLRQMTLAVPSIIPGVEQLNENGERLYDEEGNPVMSKDEVYFTEDADSPKLDAITKILLGTDEQQLLGDDATSQSALILTSSQKFMTPAVAQLRAAGIEAVEWSGKVNDTTRAQIKEQFISGQIRVIVAVVASIGTGTDGLQFATNNLIWAEHSDDLSSNLQAQGRLDRRGQTKQVINIEVVANDSMDDEVISTQLRRALALQKSLRKEQLKERRKAA